MTTAIFHGSKNFIKYKISDILQWAKQLNIRKLSTNLDNSKVEKTSLYDFHVSNNGKMVNFAGYFLPVQYADLGIAASHLHTRKHSSIFDVSHMLQSYIRGKHSVECFETICTADLQGLSNNSGSLTIFTNDQGNILDDLIVSKISENCLYIVSNAAMKAQDIEIMKTAVDKFKSNGKDVHFEFLTPLDRTLLAIQGPESIKALQQLTNFDLSRLFFMMTTLTNIGGIEDCRITRCGYTGEDGVEISVPAEKSREIVEMLLNIKQYNIKLAGLGARDSLRLEAGLCLYGSDIDANTNPIEANLAWLVAKRRRAEENFPGASKINEQLKNGVQRRRVGFRNESGPPARQGVIIYDDNNNNTEIGFITSGCPSPSIGGNIAMGYIKEDFKKIGTNVQLKIRNKMHAAKISKMPFVQSNYYTKQNN